MFFHVYHYHPVVFFGLIKHLSGLLCVNWLAWFVWSELPEMESQQLTFHKHISNETIFRWFLGYSKLDFSFPSAETIGWNWPHYLSIAAILLPFLAFLHRWPRNRWFLTLNKSILYIIFLLQLSETRRIVFYGTNFKATYASCTKNHKNPQVLNICIV